jgi:outer membrane protein assembly factor BamD (BamD/ComL family)
MNRWSIRLLLVALCWFATISQSPAPLIYQPGEGWIYEKVGGEGKWTRTRAKDQLEVAKTAFEAKDYSTALKAARRTVKVWPLSDYAPEAQYLIGRCYEARGKDEQAFREYQKVVERYPKLSLFREVQQRQFGIAEKYLGGKWFKLWGVIPYGSSMDKTAEMYDKIVRSGPYSDVAPAAQMQIGRARELSKEFPLAVKAYERAADRYSDRPEVAADALFKAGMAHRQQSKAAEYDQSAAGDAIAVLTDFMTLYPGDPRFKEAEKEIADLRREQARGSFEIARFYEKRRRFQGALVYYNEVLVLDAASPYAEPARKRIEELKAANK